MHNFAEYPWEPWAPRAFSKAACATEPFARKQRPRLAPFGLAAAAWFLAQLPSPCQWANQPNQPNQQAPLSSDTLQGVAAAPSILLSPPATEIVSELTPERMNRLTSTEVDILQRGTVAPVARTSGVSTPSGTSAPVFENPALISNLVQPNAFQPADLVTDFQPVTLEPLNPKGLWDLSLLGTSSVNYDSNITRDSGSHTGDAYFHEGGGFDFRYGAPLSIVAVDLTYSYTADIFNKYDIFNTYTHDLAYSMRIGRSNFVMVPYFVARYRSISTEAAADSGREAYNFAQAGVHGEYSYRPDLIQTYDFSHSSISYPNRVDDDFELWDLSQQLNYTLQPVEVHDFVQSITVFPWLEFKQTVPQRTASVDEISGGVGGGTVLANNLTLKGKVGWGNVSSGDHSINYDSFSGLRFDASLVYQPLRYLLTSLEYRRDLNFNPITNSRETDELIYTLAAPCAFTPHITVTPSFEVYRAVSKDYTLPQSATYLQPSLTTGYVLNQNFAAYLKILYSSRIDDEFGTTAYTTDFQASLGIDLLF